MKLISCNDCGVVLDQDKLHFASDIYDDDGSVDDNLAQYNPDTRTYEASVPCPVCNESIFKD